MQVQERERGGCQRDGGVDTAWAVVQHTPGDGFCGAPAVRLALQGKEASKQKKFPPPSTIRESGGNRPQRHNEGGCKVQ